MIGPEYSKNETNYYETAKKQHRITVQSILTMGHLEKEIQTYLTRVYTLLSFTVIAAFIGSSLGQYFGPFTEMVYIPLICFAIVLIAAIVLTTSTQQNAFYRSSLLIFFGLIQGFLIAPLIIHVSKIDNTIPLKALLLTSLVFVCFSLSAIYADRRSYLYLYGILSCCISGLFLLSMLNIFVHSNFIENMSLFGGLIVFSLFVAVDTQMIIERASYGELDSVHAALSLFLDACNIFIRIIRILGKKNKK